MTNSKIEKLNVLAETKYLNLFELKLDNQLIKKIKINRRVFILISINRVYGIIINDLD